ncbi:MAG: hypothetical protein KAR40_09685 [Candidatus Sabulitectum sp.]|nr:hypothetical protein [Candidatus Sabulitectum sp.]
MSTSTANDIINQAYQKAGVDSPSPSQTTKGLDALNNFITSMSIEGLMIPFMIRENFTLTTGDGEYTIGSGADFNTVRPLKITAAFLRDSNTDYRLNISPLKEYNVIREKTSGGRPENLYYLAELANGKILFDYEPDKAYELYIDSEKEIAEFALTSTTIASILIPNAYKRFLIFNLAVDLSSDVDSDLSALQFDKVVKIADRTMRSIKTYNASVRGIKEARYDSEMTFPLRK